MAWLMCRLRAAVPLDAAPCSYNVLRVYPKQDICLCRPMKNSLGRDGIKELVKVVVSAKDDKVLGFHMVGSEASEIMQVRALWPKSLVLSLSG